MSSTKIPKPLAVYLPVGPPPFVWVYKCFTCAYYQSPNRCVIVDGDISPDAWCVFWTNRDTDAPFSWLFTPSAFTFNGKSYVFTYVAKYPDELKRGLQGRAVTSSTTMLFAFPGDGDWQFWMASVDAPLDMIWLDSSGKVVNVVKNVQVRDAAYYRSPVPARYVIEARAGFADATGIQNGSLLALS